MTNPNQWTSEWPTEPGMYWFYGWAFLNKPRPVGEAKMVLARMVLGQNGAPVYVSRGRFMYDEECIGLWTPAILPDAPLEQLKELA